MAVTGVVLTLVPAAASAPAPDLSRVSLGPAGEQVQGPSRLADTRAVTAHGERVVFQTPASLVPADLNDDTDVYLRDEVAGTTTLVSVDMTGAAAGGSSASTSTDGNRVAFLSRASLVPADTDDDLDAYVRTMDSQTTVLVSAPTAGLAAGRGEPYAVELSGDGSTAVLVTPQRLLRKDTDPRGVESWRRFDIYAVNVDDRRKRLVTVDRGGRSFTGWVGLGGVSYDANVIGFHTTTAGLRRVPRGSWVSYAGKPRTRLVWREDMTGRSFALEGTPAVSGNGRFLALPTARPGVDDEGEPQLLDLVRLDLRTGRRVLVCCAEGSRYEDAYNPLDPTLSHRGGRLAFTIEIGGSASDVNDWDDVYLADIPSGRQPRLISRTTSGAGNGASGSYGVGISADGRHVVFSSFATDLVPDDTNEAYDVFLWSDAS